MKKEGDWIEKEGDWNEKEGDEKLKTTPRC